jgi:aspartyl/glutamyl-tRNA(Asn/Gln) amidotransferase C subunit
MTIDEQTVDKIAHLARLELAPGEKAEMIADMNKILGFMDKLNEVDTTGVEPPGVHDRRAQHPARRCGEAGDHHR